MRRPGGAVRPATKPTTGFGLARVRLYFSRYSAASSSMVPPISPMMTIPCSKIEFTGTASVLKATITVCVFVSEENLDHVDVLCAGERISSNADAERLSQTSVGSLCDRLVRQRPGTGNDAFCVIRSKTKTELWGITVPIRPGL